MYVLMKLTTKITPHNFNPKSLESNIVAKHATKSLESNIVAKHATHTCYQDYMSSEKKCI